MTVKSVGLAPAGTFHCPGSASVQPPFVRETIKDVHRNSSTSIYKYVERERERERESHGRGRGGRVIQAAHVSGFRINFSKQFTPMMMTAQTQHNVCKGGGGGEGRGNRLCRYLPAKGGGVGAGSNRRDEGFSKH
ncbi:uncharacterized [Lates japonicus]